MAIQAATDRSDGRFTPFGLAGAGRPGIEIKIDRIEAGLACVDEGFRGTPALE